MGNILPLAAVADEVFASGALGKGVAIQTKRGKVLAPANGTILYYFQRDTQSGLRRILGLNC